MSNFMAESYPDDS